MWKLVKRATRWLLHLGGVLCLLVVLAIAVAQSTRGERTLADWAKEKLGLGETSAEHNRKLLTAYLDAVVPLTDEIRSLRMRLSAEVVQIFHPDAPWT